MSDGEIFIDHAHVQTFRQDMEGYTKQIGGFVDEMKSAMWTIVKDWHGADSNFYSAIHEQWTNEVNQLGVILNGYDEVLGEASDLYKQTVNSTVRDLETVRFGG